MTDIVKKNRLDWEEYSEKYQAFNLSDSILERLKARPESAFAYTPPGFNILLTLLYMEFRSFSHTCNWHKNPVAALPEMIAFAGRKLG